MVGVIRFPAGNGLPVAAWLTHLSSSIKLRTIRPGFPFFYMGATTMLHRTVLIALAFFAFASSASAQLFHTDPYRAPRPAYEHPYESHTGRLYISASGGAIFPADSESHALRNELGASNSISFDTGYSAVGALGIHWQSFRFEVEGGYRAADIDRGSIMGVDLPSEVFRGDISIITVMANAYYDIPVSDAFDIYVGGGVGMAHVDGNIRGEASVNGVAVSFEDDSDTIVAWQIMAGVGVPLTDRITLTTGYRLFSGSNPSFELGKFEMPLIHTVELGLRFTF